MFIKVDCLENHATEKDQYPTLLKGQGKEQTCVNYDFKEDRNIFFGWVL